MVSAKKKYRDNGKLRYPADPKERNQRSLAVCEKLKRDPTVKACEHVGVFFPQAWEVDLVSLWQWRPEAVVFPRVLDKKKRSMQFFPMVSMNDLSPDLCGIPAPKETQPIAWSSGDIILVPGLAFDRAGGRVGSGWGFYDRFLASLPQGVSRWGVCWPEQVITGSLPLESTDLPMDGLYTENGFQKC